MPSTVPMSAGAQALVRKYYLYAGIYTLAASIIWGINTLFLLDAGLSIAELFIANAAFSVGTVLFEIPTGAVADTIGRRASFLLSLIVLAISTMLYVGLAQWGGGVAAFAGVSLLMGLGFTFYSGATEAWLVDGVTELGYTGNMDSIFTTAQIIGGVAIIVGTIGGGLLGQIDLALPFVLRSLLLVLLLILAFFGMRDIGFEPRSVTMRSLPGEATAIARTGIQKGWRSRPLRLIMIAGALQNGFFFWMWYAWQPYFLELLERDAVWVAGVVAALLSVAMIVGNSLVKFLTQFCGRRTTMLIGATAVFSLGSIGVGLATSFPIALGFLLIAAVGMGVQMPVRQAFIHTMVESKERATVVSFDSLITGIGAAGGQAGLGVFSERQGYSAGYIVGGAVTLLAVPIVWLARRTNTEADFFSGTKSDGSPACVPHGLPAITHVKSHSPG